MNRVAFSVVCSLAGGCAPVFTVGGVEVISADQNMVVQSPVLLLGDAESTLQLRWSGGAERVVAVYQSHALTADGAPEVVVALDEWRMNLPVEAHQARPLAIGYQRSVEVALPIGVVTALASRPGAKWVAFGEERTLAEQHQRSLQEFVDRLIELRAESI